MARRSVRQSEREARAAVLRADVFATPELLQESIEAMRRALVDGQAERLTVQELKDWLRAHRQPLVGKKEELRRRAAQYCGVALLDDPVVQ